MKWTLEVTHPPTGEEMLVRVDAATHAQAVAAARDRGLFVRDCYRAGRGFYKGARTLAWVWFGVFTFLTVVAVLCGFGGAFQTAGNSGVGGAFGTVAVLGMLAALGLLVARAMTDALRRGAPSDPRRGFDVVPTSDTPSTPNSRSGEEERL